MWSSLILCRNGHKRTESNTKYRHRNGGKQRECRECRRMRAHRYKQSHRAYLAAHMRVYRARDLAKTLMQRYGGQAEDYHRLLSLQGNACAICKEQKKLVVDHDHQTGKVRGLLCTACNNGLGVFSDNSIRLRIAVDYLEAVSL